MPVRFPVLSSTGQIKDEDCLTAQELALLLHTTRDAVYRKTSNGEWPYFKVIRRVYFTPEHVRQILTLADHQPNGSAPRNLRHLKRGES